MAGVVHIAGNIAQVGIQLRQRCAWCGALLIDVNLERIAYTADTPPEERHPATWPPGHLVEIDGPASWVLPLDDAMRLPEGACGRLDVEVTR